jgi:hypothetical protein
MILDAGGTIAQQDAPPWMTEAEQYFITIQAGDKWKKLVCHWMHMEKQLGYPDGSVSCHFSITLNIA